MKREKENYRSHLGNACELGADMADMATDTRLRLDGVCVGVCVSLYCCVSALVVRFPFLEGR